MEIVVTGRNVEVPEHFRGLVEEKLTRLERHDHKIVGMEVELFHEPNRRQQKSCQRVEITGRGGCGAVARAEASAADFYAALDMAAGKLAERLRRSHDRRKPSRRDRVHASRVAANASAVALMEQAPSTTDTIPAPRSHDETLPDDALAGLQDAWEVDHVPGRVVRDKTHAGAPMTVDEALSRMELVGHDFYLFACSSTGRPSVVYRRHGYDYGVIRLGG